MKVQEVPLKEKDKFNSLVTHPLQSWEWGEFRKKTGIEIIRLGVYENNNLKEAYQIFVHPLPKLPFNILYFPKGPKPNKTMLKTLEKIGQEKNAIMVKMEPNFRNDEKVKDFLLTNKCKEGKPLFTKFTFQLDLKQTPEEILKKMKSKTRYNIRVAERHNVEVIEDNSSEAFEDYLKLTQETTKRQGFYAHSVSYHRKMWASMRENEIAHLFLAKYKKEILGTYIFFIFNNVLYYPYGASSRKHRQAMPLYGLFWEAIKFGQKMDCHSFDMWGSSGPNVSPKNPYFGFHRFKEGFGGELIEFLGTYDLVINSKLYFLFNILNNLRWGLLHLKRKVNL